MVTVVIAEAAGSRSATAEVVLALLVAAKMTRSRGRCGAVVAGSTGGHIGGGGSSGVGIDGRRQRGCLEGLVESAVRAAAPGSCCGGGA